MSRPSDMLSAAHDERMEELAAGYALDALETEDAAAFLTHARGCEWCAVLVLEYRAVTSALGLSVPEMDASPELRERLLRMIAADEAADSASSAGPSEPRTLPVPRPARGAARGRSPIWGLATAALLLVSLGLGYWNWRLQEEIRQLQLASVQEQQLMTALAAGAQRHALTSTGVVPNAHGMVVPDPSGGDPFILLANLPELPGGRTYQAWVVGPQGPVDAGVLPEQSGGTLVARLTRLPRPGETVALTEEPAGGVPAPTGQVILAGVI